MLATRVHENALTLGLLDRNAPKFPWETADSDVIVMKFAAVADKTVTFEPSQVKKKDCNVREVTPQWIASGTVPLHFKGYGHVKRVVRTKIDALWREDYRNFLPLCGETIRPTIKVPVCLMYENHAILIDLLRQMNGQWKWEKDHIRQVHVPEGLLDLSVSPFFPTDAVTLSATGQVLLNPFDDENSTMKFSFADTELKPRVCAHGANPYLIHLGSKGHVIHTLDVREGVRNKERIEKSDLMESDPIWSLEPLKTPQHGLFSIHAKSICLWDARMLQHGRTLAKVSMDLERPPVGYDFAGTTISVWSTKNNDVFMANLRRGWEAYGSHERNRSLEEKFEPSRLKPVGPAYVNLMGEVEGAEQEDANENEQPNPDDDDDEDLLEAFPVPAARDQHGDVETEDTTSIINHPAHKLELELDDSKRKYLVETVCVPEDNYTNHSMVQIIGGFLQDPHTLITIDRHGHMHGSIVPVPAPASDHNPSTPHSQTSNPSSADP